MLIAVSIFALLAVQEADVAKDRERLADVVRRLGDDDFEARRKAQKDLLSLPVALAAELDRLAENATDAEVKFSLRGARVPRVWQFLPCTIGQAPEWIARLESGNPATVQEALRALERRTPEAVEQTLRALLDHGGPGARSFALDGYTRFPPRSAAPFVALLRAADSKVRAAEVILGTGDASVVPDLLPIFTGGGPGSLESARILLAFGADVSPADCARAIGASSDLVHLGCRLIARCGGAAEPVLLELLAQPKLNRDPILIALGDVGGPAALDAVRSVLEADGRSHLRDRVLARMRDPEWALARLAEARAKPDDLRYDSFENLAATGAPGLRDAVLEWIRTPDLKAGVLKRLLPLLGAVGRREDGALIAEHLRDRRVVEGVVEGLELLGDPAFAGPVMQAFKRSGGAPLLGRWLLSFPAAGFEDDIIELISDPEGYRWGQSVAYQLAFRRMTPTIREALWKSLVSGNYSTAGFRGEILRRLMETPSPDDGTWIARLKEQKSPSVRAAGFLLELRRGDPAAAAPLVELLVGASLEATYLDGAALPDPGTIPAAVGAWEKAVADQWRAKPEWVAGAAWMASRGHREAADALRKSLDKINQMVRPQAEAVLVAQGEDLPNLQQFLYRQHGLRDPKIFDQFIRALTPAATTALLRQARGLRSPGSEAALEVAARLTLPEGIPLFCNRLRDDGRNNNSDVAVLTECIAALGRLRVKAVIPDLRLQLRSESAAVRAAAIRALVEFGDRASIPRIAELLDDPAVSATTRELHQDRLLQPPAPRVSLVAVEALERLTGTPSQGAAAVDKRRFWKEWNETHRNDRK